MANQKFILITRPEPDSSDFGARVKLAGLEPMVCPALKIERLPYTAPDLTKYHGLVFTSTNAVRFLPPGMAQSMPVYCVGDRTAREAKIHGFREITSAGGNAADLAVLLKYVPGTGIKKFLHISGRHVAGADLKTLNMVDNLEIYKTVRAENLPPSCVRAMKERQVEAVTFFSARTARTFVNLAQKHGLLETFSAIKLLCISDSVLQSVRTYGWAGTYTAKAPDAPAMLDLIKSVCAKS